MNPAEVEDRYIEAPQPYTGTAPSIFLAGGITDCPNWQADAAYRILTASDTAVVLNPRRANFPIEDPSAARAQIEWEFHLLTRVATVALFWFPASTSIQPIALFELGRYVALRKRVVIGCDPLYLRRLDVVEQMRLALPKTVIYDNLAAVCHEATEAAHRAIAPTQETRA